GEDLQPTTNALSPALGGMLCPACRVADSSARQLSVNAQKYLRTLDRAGLGEAIKLRLDDSLRSEIEGALAAYLRHIIDRDLASLRAWPALQIAAPERRYTETRRVATRGSRRRRFAFPWRFVTRPRSR